MKAPEDLVLTWTQKLTGLQPERVQAARGRVRTWGIAHLSEELLACDVDAAVAATLLAEDVELLAGRGVPETKLLAKLRNDREVWAAWAELRAAAILIKLADPDAEIELEPGSSRGAHPDLRLKLPDEEWGTSVEIKAVGLSDQEVEYCQRAAPELKTLVPPKDGLVTLHTPLTVKTVKLPRSHRLDAFRDAHKRVDTVPGYPKGLKGSVIVGRGGEPNYVRRALARIGDALRQLPSQDECWVALFWSNGAPIVEVLESLVWEDLPEHVVGLVFVGSAVAFPHAEIHNFANYAPRGLDLAEPPFVESTLDEHFATLVRKRFEHSSGLRLTLLRGPAAHDLLRRDGTRRIVPYNLLMDDDPPSVDRQSEWGRATRTMKSAGQPRIFGPID